jgi:hypothetical protein
MQGVYVFQPEDVGELADTMTRVALSGSGRIASPEILRHTPESFAGVFQRAIESARKSEFIPEEHA